ncbi:hypothetical protein [Kitasatospora sp. P5_F3]
MSGELVIAITTAGVSVSAAGIAIWQAVIARRQATTAKDAASFAQRQAAAAEVGAVAAQEQVALMRRQLDAEDTERRQARGPEFTVTSGVVDRVTDNNYVRAVVTLRQTSGPSLSSIVVIASGPVMTNTQDTRAQFGPIAAGGSETITFDLDWDAPSEGRIVLNLECVGNSGDWWERSVSHDLVPVPDLSPRFRRL